MRWQGHSRQWEQLDGCTESGTTKEFGVVMAVEVFSGWAPMRWGLSLWQQVWAAQVRAGDRRLLAGLGYGTRMK